MTQTAVDSHHKENMDSPEFEMKRVKFDEKGDDIYKISYSRENSVDTDVENNNSTNQAKPDLFRQQSIQENDENEKRLGVPEVEKTKLLEDAPIRAKSPPRCQRSISTNGSIKESSPCVHKARDCVIRFERSESWIDSMKKKSNNLETVKSWVKKLACCTCFCLVLICGLGTLLVLYLTGTISFGHHNSHHNMHDGLIPRLPDAFEQAKAMAMSQHTLESIQLHMNQKVSQDMQQIIWIPQQGFETTTVIPSTDGCVTSQRGGRFIGFSTILFKYDVGTDKRTMTVSAVVKPVHGEEKHLNKVSEPIPGKDMRQHFVTSKPVQITFSAKLTAGDQICIRAEWDQIKISYIDNTLTLIRY